MGALTPTFTLDRLSTHPHTLQKPESNGAASAVEPVDRRSSKKKKVGWEQARLRAWTTKRAGRPLRQPRSTKALYKIIDTVLTFLSRCWIEFDLALKFERKLNNYKQVVLFPVS